MRQTTLDKLLQYAIIETSQFNAFDFLCKEIDRLQKQVNMLASQLVYSRDSE